MTPRTEPDAMAQAIIAACVTVFIGSLLMFAAVVVSAVWP